MPQRKPNKTSARKQPAAPPPKRAAIADLEHFEPADRAAWRAWLAANHATSPGVWLVYLKADAANGIARNLSYDDAVEECICFGWIDSKVNPIDARAYKQLITPRKPGSPWSALNKRRIIALDAAGLITTPGCRKIDAAKRDGSWATLDAIEALVIPDDLTAALAENPHARANFNNFPPSAKKVALTWIISAKRQETRATRIAETVRLAVLNIRANTPEARGK
jgi:uncharacterized protein YdeI (YjbR/CyaY-like superfamily)